MFCRPSFLCRLVVCLISCLLKVETTKYLKGTQPTGSSSLVNGNTSLPFLLNLSPHEQPANKVNRNIPVHRFLQRHVYGASRPHMSRPVATLVTFLISALAHELVLFCITKKLRGYGFVCQMLQLPIIVVQRTEFMKSYNTFNNIMFWCSMIWGLAMVSSE